MLSYAGGAYSLFPRAEEVGAEEEVRKRSRVRQAQFLFSFFLSFFSSFSVSSSTEFPPSRPTMLRHAASRILAGAMASTSAASSSTAAWATLLPPMARNAAAANAATATAMTTTTAASTTIRFASASPSSGNSLVAAASEGAKAVTRGLIVDTLGLVSLFAFAVPIFCCFAS